MLVAWLLALYLNPPRSELDTVTARTEQLLVGAAARIERYRKADATVEVVDRWGEPVARATVKVEQIRHRFLFGCAATSLLNHSAANQEETYQTRFSEIFNFATVLTYWHDTEPVQGRLNLTKLEAQAKRLRQIGIRVKGHPLILAGAIPRWAPSDPDEVRALNRRRIGEMVSRFRGLIDVWDVVGDATTAGGAQNGLGAWARKAGPARLTADALSWSRSANPAALLMYNDYKLDAEYSKLIRDVLTMGAPLDALGLEAHMIGSEWTLEKVWNTAESFSGLGKALHFSEITVLSDDPVADHRGSWPSTPEGERRQANYVAKLYTLLFSHPAVSAIAWWNFADGDWDRYPGGLLHSDLSPKPAYERLRRLIKEKWWTREEVVSDSTGFARFRGFAGRYRFTVESGRSTKSMEANVDLGRRNRITMRID